MPAPAFRDAAGVAEIRADPPSLVTSYGPPVRPASDPDDEQALARTNLAHRWLYGLESQLRRFIDARMTAAFGSSWPKSRLASGVYDAWTRKKEAAERAGAPTRPLIAYADFTDYDGVITRRDNWREVFEVHFRRPEDLRESLQRLYPVRLDTMHARPITQDDESLLHVETRRISRVISS